MILSPHEVMWLMDNIGHFTGDDPSTGLPNRIVGTAVVLCESDTSIPHVDGADFDVMARSKDVTKATFGQRDHGGAMISGYWHSAKLQAHALAGEDWRDPRVQVAIMREVYDETERAKGAGRGWEAWQVYLLKPDGNRSMDPWIPDAKIATRNPWPPPQTQDLRAVLREVLGSLDEEPKVLR